MVGISATLKFSELLHIFETSPWFGAGMTWWQGVGVAWVGAGEVGAGLDRGRSGPKALFNTLS